MDTRDTVAYTLAEGAHMVTLAVGATQERRPATLLKEEENQKAKSKRQKVKIEDLSPIPSTQHPTPPLVGRESALAQLHGWLDKARGGQRQIVFVSGELGIGKTTLIDAFLAQVREQEHVRITSGQCVEQYGVSEAYLPLLEATTRLCRAPGGERRLEVLKQYAPSWAVQLPALVVPHEREVLQQRAHGGSRERMLREMAEAAELFTSQRCLVLVLEDLHWSDTATLEWLTYMARRREPARLLILGTYRSTDIAVSGHPLKGLVSELHAHNQCEALPLEPLTPSAVHDYLAQRFPGMTIAAELSSAVHQRTEGNPLFLSNIVHYLIEQSVIIADAEKCIVASDMQIVEHAAPKTLRQLIEQQLERLDPHAQALLEVASVVGAEFSVAAVAAGLQQPRESLEQVCEQLARRGQFITAQGMEEWPDGVISGCYHFTHVLYLRVLYDRLAPASRVQIHRRIAEQKEAAYGARVSEIAGELAAHYAQGRDRPRAVHYHSLAGVSAMQRHAHHEAITHLTKGLELLQALPVSPEHDQQELQLYLTMGVSLINTKGYAAPEVEQTYSRAWELCQQLGHTPQLFSALWGLASFSFIRAQFARALELGTQLVGIADRAQDPDLQIEASLIAGSVHLFSQGKVPAARAHLEQVIALYEPERHRTHTFRYGQDPGVSGRLIVTAGLWCAGYPDQALQRGQEALALTQDFLNPYDRALAYSWGAFLHQYRGEGELLRAQAQTAIAFSTEHGLAFLLPWGKIAYGWALVEEGALAQGMAEIQQGIATEKAFGAEFCLPYFLSLLAAAHGRAGQTEAGLQVLEEAFAAVRATDAHLYEAELYRLKGELALAGAGGWGLGVGSSSPQVLSLKPQVSRAVEQEAEECFLNAIATARQQQTKSWELRAATSLARLWQQQNKVDEARELLEGIYSWFTEGFATRDLQEAEALLVTLGGRVKTDDEKRTTGRMDDRANGREENGEFVTPSPRRPFAPAFSSSQSPIPTPEPLSPNVFRREGDYWTLTFAGAMCRVRHTLGMHYLAQLLQHPRHEFSVLALASESTDLTPSLSPVTHLHRHDARHIDIPHAVHSELSDAGAHLDPQAKTAYKRRLQELHGELDEAQAFNDSERADKIREEIGFLTAEISRAVGLGGRQRKAASPLERARVNVTLALKTALKRITAHHPALGQYLTRTIKTGYACVYIPDPYQSVIWEF